MSASLVIAPEADSVWARVDAARVALDARTAYQAAETDRITLALVLADTLFERADHATALVEYSRARVAHETAGAHLVAAREDLLVARGGPSTPSQRRHR